MYRNSLCCWNHDNSDLRYAAIPRLPHPPHPIPSKKMREIKRNHVVECSCQLVLPSSHTHTHKSIRIQFSLLIEVGHKSKLRNKTHLCCVTWKIQALHFQTYINYEYHMFDVHGMENIKRLFQRTNHWNHLGSNRTKTSYKFARGQWVQVHDKWFGFCYIQFWIFNDCI